MKRVMSISLGLAFLAALGCGKGSKDSGPVLATVGSEKITEKEFKDLVGRIAPDPDSAKKLLEDPNPMFRGQRNRMLGQLAEASAVIQLAKQQGLDSDPRVQAAVKLALANAYQTAMLSNRMPAKLEPKEEDLKATYDRYGAQAKAAGQPMPPFEQVKPQLAEAWRRDEQDRVRKQLKDEIAKRVPSTFAEGYAPQALEGF